MRSLTIDGVDTYRSLRMVLSGKRLDPPKEIYRMVDNPAGPSIDLTEALGGPFYGDRMQEFDFTFVGTDDFERFKSKLSAFLHNRRHEYSLSWDPGYTYSGRFRVVEYEEFPGYGKVKVEVTADPWKTKGVQSYRIDAAGGRMFRFESGMRPVRPTIECANPVRVQFGGKVTNLPAGTWRLNDVLFERGWNEIYINSYEVVNTAWYELAEGEAHAMTWADASKYRWDEIRALNGEGLMRTKTWEDMAQARWEDLAETRWAELRRSTPLEDSNEVYLTYDWSDL